MLQSNNPTGRLHDVLQYWEILLSPQVLLSLPEFWEVIYLWKAIVTTVARRLLRVVWELISRIVTTFMLFGIFESVRSALNKVISNIFVQGGQNQRECEPSVSVAIPLQQGTERHYGWTVLLWVWVPVKHVSTSQCCGAGHHSVSGVETLAT